MPRVDVNGTTLQFEIDGSGAQTVVFLNGIAMSIAHWKPVEEALAARYRCLRHDFRGQLLSPQTPSGKPVTLENHVDDLRCLLEHLGITRAHVVGTSYGAEVGMMFTFLNGPMVSSLCVIDGASELDPLLRATAEGWKAAALADPVAFYRTIIPWNYSSGFIRENSEMLAKREASVAALPRSYFEDFAALCDAFLAIDMTSRLPAITCPTLVMVGEKDILKHAGFARIIAGAISGASVRLIPGAGHAAVIEQPELVAREVAAFLGGQ